MGKIEQIKELYSKLDKKTKFIAEVATYFGLNPQYVRGHYFSAFWTIPDDKQGEVINLLEQKIESQKVEA